MVHDDEPLGAVAEKAEKLRLSDRRVQDEEVALGPVRRPPVVAPQREDVAHEPGIDVGGVDLGGCHPPQQVPQLEGGVGHGVA